MGTRGREKGNGSNRGNRSNDTMRMGENGLRLRRRHRNEGLERGKGPMGGGNIKVVMTSYAINNGAILMKREKETERV